jgi:hypothetical protein
MRKIFSTLVVLMLIICLIPIGGGENIERNDYGQFQHPSTMNWTIPKTYVAPNVTTEFNSGLVDNITDGTANWNATYPVSPIDGTKALYMQWQTGATNNYFRKYTVLTKTLFSQIYITANYTNDYAPYFYYLLLHSSGDKCAFTFRFYTSYVTATIDMISNAVSETRFVYFDLSNRTGSNTTLSIMGSWDEVNATTLCVVGGSFSEIYWDGMERDEIHEMNQATMRLYATGSPSFYIDNMYQYNVSFTEEEIKNVIRTDPVVVFPPLNKDFAFTDMMHADVQTYNQSVPYFEFMNDIGLKSTFSIWSAFDGSTNTSSEPLNYTNWTNLLIAQNSLGHEICTHSWSDTLNLNETNVMDNITLMNIILGIDPKGTIDHGSRLHNIEYHGSNSSSDYYVVGAYTNITWWWVNWDADNGENTKPAQDYSENMFDIMQGWGICYNMTMDVGLTDDRFVQGGISQYNFPLYEWNGYDFLSTVAGSRGVMFSHGYLNRVTVLNISGTYYTYNTLFDTHYPELNYQDYPSGNYKEYDDQGNWEITAPARCFYENMTRDYDVYSVPVKDMVERARFIRNVTTSFYGSTYHINVTGTDSEDDVTVSCVSNMTDKSLYDGSSYYAFTPAEEGWGATITTLGPGNNQYNIVDTPLNLTTSLKIGKFEYDTVDEMIRLNVNKGNGVVHVEIPDDWDVTDLRVYDRTLGTFVDWDEGSVEFDGVSGHLYFIYVDQTGTPMSPGFSPIITILISGMSMVIIVVILNNALISPMRRIGRLGR